MSYCQSLSNLISFPFDSKHLKITQKVNQRTEEIHKTLLAFAKYLDTHFPRSPLKRIAKNFDIAMQCLYPSFKMREDFKTANKIIDEYLKEISILKLYYYDTQEYVDIEKSWLRFTTLQQHFIELYTERGLWVKSCIMAAMCDTEKFFQARMEWLKYIIDKKLRQNLDCCYLIIEFVMKLMKEMRNSCKKFPQFHYCLSYCLQMLSNNHDGAKDGVGELNSYLHFAWAYYIGSLLVYTKDLLSGKALKTELDESVVRFGVGVYVTYDFRFKFPTKPIFTKYDMNQVQDNIDILKEDLLYWGDLLIGGNYTAYDFLLEVEKHAYLD